MTIDIVYLRHYWRWRCVEARELARAIGAASGVCSGDQKAGGGVRGNKERKCNNIKAAASSP